VTIFKGKKQIEKNQKLKRLPVLYLYLANFCKVEYNMKKRMYDEDNK
jgi:hypothetical protein